MTTMSRRSLLTSLADLDLRRTAAQPGARHSWADVAKGISIILLVVWHVSGFHEVFTFVRMPLFFLVAGVFATRVVCRASTDEFWRDKIGNLLYLYLLWSGAFYALVGIVRSGGSAYKYFGWKWLQVLWAPPPTMWFIYALTLTFVLARLVRHVPYVIVALISLSTFLLVQLSLSGSPPFLHRVGALFPFFWAGILIGVRLSTAIENLAGWWLVWACLYILAAMSFGDVSTPGFNVLFLGTSSVGLLAMLTVSHRIATSGVGRLLAMAGRSSIYIYLMHRILLEHIEMILEKFRIDFSGAAVVKVVVVTVTCVVLGRWLTSLPVAAWLLRAPWVGRNRKIPRQAHSSIGDAAVG